MTAAEDYVIFGKRRTPPLGPAKRALILSIVGVSGSEVRVPPAAIYGTARAVNSNGLSHRRRTRSPPHALHPVEVFLGACNFEVAQEAGQPTGARRGRCEHANLAPRPAPRAADFALANLTSSTQ
ncbi:unnamed protein product [Diatraea saccharalis]|uniref:Uncharacterized protein n=1 Tax=Diatraea saccharalis TaxID=40085 RepID=A0A9N9QVY9_9NEOP|nr:unnamed protein product [Diatraea saccharalis]